MDDSKSLAHSKWRCKYHLVFAPKYRRQVIYGKIKGDIGTILRKLCEYKGVEFKRIFYLYEKAEQTPAKSSEPNRQ